MSAATNRRPAEGEWTDVVRGKKAAARDGAGASQPRASLQRAPRAAAATKAPPVPCLVIDDALAALLCSPEPTLHFEMALSKSVNGACFSKQRPDDLTRQVIAHLRRLVPAIPTTIGRLPPALASRVPPHDVLAAAVAACIADAGSVQATCTLRVNEAKGLCFYTVVATLPDDLCAVLHALLLAVHAATVPVQLSTGATATMGLLSEDAPRQPYTLVSLDLPGRTPQAQDLARALAPTPARTAALGGMQFVYIARANPHPEGGTVLTPFAAYGSTLHPHVPDMPDAPVLPLRNTAWLSWLAPGVAGSFVALIRGPDTHVSRGPRDPRGFGVRADAQGSAVRYVHLVRLRATQAAPPTQPPPVPTAAATTTAMDVDAASPPAPPAGADATQVTHATDPATTEGAPVPSGGPSALLAAAPAAPVPADTVMRGQPAPAVTGRRRSLSGAPDSPLPVVVDGPAKRANVGVPRRSPREHAALSTGNPAHPARAAAALSPTTAPAVVPATASPAAPHEGTSS